VATIYKDVNELGSHESMKQQESEIFPGFLVSRFGWVVAVTNKKAMRGKTHG
jgi:hypothetical protein